MIRHIVFFTAVAPKIDDVRKGLGLLAEIPYARHFEIGFNLKHDLFGNEVDLVVYAEFEDTAALAAYKAHPLYQASIDAVKPIRDLRIGRLRGERGDRGPATADRSVARQLTSVSQPILIAVALR